MSTPDIFTMDRGTSPIEEMRKDKEVDKTMVIVRKKISLVEGLQNSMAEAIHSLNSAAHLSLAALKNMPEFNEDPYNSFTTVSLYDIKKKMQINSSNHTIICSPASFIQYPSPSDMEERIVIFSTDGSLLSTSGRRTSGFAVIIKRDSVLNFEGACFSRRSSTLPEIIGISEAIHFGVSQGIKKLCIVSDSVTGMKVIAESLYLPISGSVLLQQCCLIEPSLKRTFNKLHNVYKKYNTLGLLYQEAHVPVSDIFSELNSLADVAAKAAARESAINLLPTSRTPQPSESIISSGIGDALNIVANRINSDPAVRHVVTFEEEDADEI